MAAAVVGAVVAAAPAHAAIIATFTSSSAYQSATTFVYRAKLLGGVSLAGGRGAPLGLLAGTLSVALLAQIVAVTALPDFLHPTAVRGPARRHRGPGKPRIA